MRMRVRARVRAYVAADAAKAITWPARLEAGGDLDVAGRLRLIASLGFIAKRWCAQILVQAYEEEADADVRAAVLQALRRCNDPLATPTFVAGARSPDARQRSLAAEGLAALGNFEPLVGLLDDPELPVALTAAHALQRGGGAALLEANLSGRNGDSRAAELRRMLGAMENSSAQ
jgi:HEAT repeat protein